METGIMLSKPQCIVYGTAIMCFCLMAGCSENRTQTYVYVREPGSIVAAQPSFTLSLNGVIVSDANYIARSLEARVGGSLRTTRIDPENSQYIYSLRTKVSGAEIVAQVYEIAEGLNIDASQVDVRMSGSEVTMRRLHP
jgi:hypothetical protein